MRLAGQARRVFTAVLTVFTGIVLYWFLAGRSDPFPETPEPTSGSATVQHKTSPPAASIAPVFTNVTGAAGIDFTYFNDAVPDRFYLPEVMGGGAGWIDYDQDGKLDLYLVNGCQLAEDPFASTNRHQNRLYRNLGQGHFEDATLASSTGDRQFGHGCAVGDYDADGFPDLYISNFGSNTLLHNNGDGTYEDITGQARIGDRSWSFSCIWIDLDLDEDLDLYVTNYLDWDFANSQVCEQKGAVGYCGPGKYRGLADHVYLNQGDGTFQEAATRLGITGMHPKGLGVAGMDLDNDLRPEIYVANDESANFLFTTTAAVHTNETDGSERLLYQNRARETGCALSGDGFTEASMGIVCLDYNRDSHLDLFLTHFFEQKNTLYAGQPKLRFSDVSQQSGVVEPSWNRLGFGTVALDYDRDGWQDLVVANGHVLGPNCPPFAMRPQLLKNRGGRFEDVSGDAGTYFSRDWLGRGMAAADFDNDGDLDLLISHLDQPVALLRNDTPATYNFVGIELQSANRIPAVGGRIIVQLPHTALVFPIVTGGSYLSTNDPRLLCGLGNHGGSVTVEIFWPSGYIQTCDLGVGQYWLIMEKRPPQSVSDS